MKTKFLLILSFAMFFMTGKIFAQGVVLSGCIQVQANWCGTTVCVSYICYGNQTIPGANDISTGTECAPPSGCTFVPAWGGSGGPVTICPPVTNCCAFPSYSGMHITFTDCLGGTQSIITGLNAVYGPGGPTARRGIFNIPGGRAEWDIDNDGNVVLNFCEGC